MRADVERIQERIVKLSEDAQSLLSQVQNDEVHSTPDELATNDVSITKLQTLITELDASSAALNDVIAAEKENEDAAK